MALITFVALGAGWQAALVGDTRSSRYAVDTDAAPVARAESAARGLPRSASTDGVVGSRTGASGRSLVLATGVPVTLLDGGATRSLRVPRGSIVTDVLEAAGVALGPLDRLVFSSGDVGAGDVVKVVRVAESTTVVREPIAFSVKDVADPTLIRGKTVLVSAGVPGVAENTYKLVAADGVLESRKLLGSVELQAPVAEVRRVGTQAPPVPGDIESIIRTAAANWGADPTQLLRVAYCESRYNPSAYNASSGASGLFQFLATTWAANSVRAGYAGASVFDPVANANTAAYMFSIGQARQWSCK